MRKEIGMAANHPGPGACAEMSDVPAGLSRFGGNGCVEILRRDVGGGCDCLNFGDLVYATHHVACGRWSGGEPMSPTTLKRIWILQECVTYAS
jgi:hypothetical protein